MTRLHRREAVAPYAPWRNLPFAVTSAEAGAVSIVAVNSAAQSGGIAPGISLSDARAILPTLKVIERHAADDRTCLDALLRWARRYSPWIAVEGFDERGGGGLWLDVTGCAHLFGGEQALLNDLRSRLNQLGFSVCLGLADTPGAAWAAARFLATESASAIVPERAQRTHLASAPTAALRLSASARETLSRLGVRTITDLLALPRGPLTRRFGSEVCLRLDQLIGRVDEPLSPETERLPYVARMAFAEPIGKTEDVEAALESLLDSLCVRLEKDRKGARRLTCEVFRVDNTAEHIDVGTGRAVRDPKHLFRLFKEKLDGLDAGFGIEFLLLTVTSTDPLETQQVAITRVAEVERTSGPQGDDLALLIDRLEGRLGAGHVVRPQNQPSHIPERAGGHVPALKLKKPSVSGGVEREARLLHSDIKPLRLGSRPIHLLPRPEPVQLVAHRGVNKSLPLSGFTWRRARHFLAAAEGPERISGTWWRSTLPPDRSVEETNYFALCEDGGAARDYWRVESEEGNRFWLFHLPFPLLRDAQDVMPRWFLHGLFA